MNALADREILELLRERPDLLAVADAVASTQRRPARRRLVRLSVVPAVAAVAATAFLVVTAPWHSGKPAIDRRLFFQRALAVVGGQPVVHFVIQYGPPSEDLVDLSTGEERPLTHRSEFWYDAGRGVIRLHTAVNGGSPSDTVSHLPRDWTAPLQQRVLDPFTGFVTKYRDALADGSARIVGQTEVAGRPAVQIAFTLGPSFTQMATVDAETYRPITVAQGDTVIHVLEIESLPYKASIFEQRGGAAPSAGGFSLAQGDAISLSKAERILGSAPLGLGPSPDAVRQGDLERSFSDGSVTHRAYVELTYGDVRISLVRIRPDALLDSGILPVPPPGSIVVIGRGPSQGFLSRDGLSVFVNAPSKRDVVDAARALEPLG